MTSINMGTAYCTGQGGDDGAGSDRYNKTAGFAVYRTRGTIDVNQSRLPNGNDITVAIDEPLVGLNAFVCQDAGSPVNGVTGASTVNPGDYLVYLSGDPTVASNWVAVNQPNYTANLPNCPNMFVRVVGTPGSLAGT